MLEVVLDIEFCWDIERSGHGVSAEPWRKELDGRSVWRRGVRMKMSMDVGELTICKSAVGSGLSKSTRFQRLKMQAIYKTKAQAGHRRQLFRNFASIQARARYLKPQNIPKIQPARKHSLADNYTTHLVMRPLHVCLQTSLQAADIGKGSYKPWLSISQVLVTSF